MTAFPIAEFNRARAWGREVGMAPWQATRHALCLAYREAPLPPLAFLSVLGLLDDADLTDAQETVLCGMTGREIAPLFEETRHRPGAFASLDAARETVRDWLAPFVELWLDEHEAHDAADGMSVLMCGLGRNLRRSRPNPRPRPRTQEERDAAVRSWARRVEPIVEAASTPASAVLRRSIAALNAEDGADGAA